ncbi:MAG: hypothetical protein FRX49_12718 [Trebouxia sp. A1-2]|nr:MAG: hypothetical protein FRX49_12718 [Trebouxia sp. A1-2]
MELLENDSLHGPGINRPFTTCASSARVTSRALVSGYALGSSSWAVDSAWTETRRFGGRLVEDTARMTGLSCAELLGRSLRPPISARLNSALVQRGGLGASAFSTAVNCAAKKGPGMTGPGLTLAPGILQGSCSPSAEMGQARLEVGLAQVGEMNYAGLEFPQELVGGHRVVGTRR